MKRNLKKASVDVRNILEYTNWINKTVSNTSVIEFRIERDKTKNNYFGKYTSSIKIKRITKYHCFGFKRGQNKISIKKYEGKRSMQIHIPRIILNRDDYHENNE